MCSLLPSASAPVGCCCTSVPVVQCYKHVSALVERQWRHAQPRERAALFYLSGKILRDAKRMHKAKSRYGAQQLVVVAAAVLLAVRTELCNGGGRGMTALSIVQHCV
jgi:hypothetical protein